MTDTSTSISVQARSLLPNLPLVLWMVGATLVLGLAGGLKTQALIETINTGFGRALGEFALILLPAFALAAALSKQPTIPASRLSVAISPIAGAGMICPDTAYAALSPIAGARKLYMAFGSYAGFKLLYPAGPLIVATGLGVQEQSLALFGIALLLPVWISGMIWARLVVTVPMEEAYDGGLSTKMLRPLAPFALMVVLLVIGAAFDFSSVLLLDFATQPKGALMLAAILALVDLPRAERRNCLDSTVTRTGALLLLIGAASALGAMLTLFVPLDEVFSAQTGMLGLLSLFVLTALFKLVQGSSMATFAAIAPVAAPIVASAGISPVGAVFAICLGSFVTILPNDSYYWLVRRDALEHLDNDGHAMWVLAGGAIVQALVGLGILISMVGLGFA